MAKQRRAVTTTNEQASSEYLLTVYYAIKLFLTPANRNNSGWVDSRNKAGIQPIA